MMLRNKFPKDMSIRQRFKNNLCMAVQQWGSQAALVGKNYPRLGPYMLDTEYNVHISRCQWSSG